MENTPKTPITLQNPVREQRSANGKKGASFKPVFIKAETKPKIMSQAPSSIDLPLISSSTTAGFPANDWEYINSSDLNPFSVNESETERHDMIVAERTTLRVRLEDQEKAQAAKDDRIACLQTELYKAKDTIDTQKEKGEQIALLSAKLDAANTKLATQGDKDKRIAFLSTELEATTKSMLASSAQKDHHINKLGKKLRKVKEINENGERIAVAKFSAAIETITSQKEEKIALEKELHVAREMVNNTQRRKANQIAYLSATLANTNVKLVAQAQKDEHIARLQRDLNAATNSMLAATAQKDRHIDKLERELCAVNEMLEKEVRTNEDLVKKFDAIMEEKVNLENEVRKEIDTTRTQKHNGEKIAVLIVKLHKAIAAQQQKDERVAELENEVGNGRETLGAQESEITHLAAQLASANGTIRTLREKQFADLEIALEQKDEEITLLEKRLEGTIDEVRHLAEKDERINFLEAKLDAAEVEIEAQKAKGEEKVEKSVSIQAELKGELDMEKKLAGKKIEYIEKLQKDVLVAKEIIAEQREELRKVPGCWNF
jgi:hypothetical protein